MGHMKHYTTKDGQQVLVPGRAQRRAHWRSERAKFREPGKPRQRATNEWRASWQPLRGDL